METLPAELLLEFIPDPDTLASMLFVCKNVNRLITEAGAFTFLDGNYILEISNKVLKFLVRNVDYHRICERTCHGRTVSAKSTKFEHYKTHGMPTIVRGINRSSEPVFMSNIGWDCVKYTNKYRLLFIKLPSGRRDTRIWDHITIVPCDKYLLVEPVPHIAAMGSIYLSGDYMEDYSNSRSNLHAVYKKVLYE